MNQYCPETSDLRLVQNIVTLGSLSAAAEKMHISQPALSRRLSRLEELLAQKVFQRLGKKLIPTAAGRALLESAANILPQLELTTQHLANLASGKTGQLRISMECVTCYYWLPAIARQFQSTHEHVQIDIVNAVGATPIQLLNRGEIDLAIHTGKEKYPGILSEELFADEFMAVMPAGHPLADREYLDPQDFRDEHLVLYNPEASAAVERFLRPAGVEAARYSGMQFTTGILEMVRANLGISFLTNWVVGRYAADELVCKKLGRLGLFRHWQVSRSVALDAPWLDDFVILLKDEHPMQ